jgi:hypothetical protein
MLIIGKLYVYIKNFKLTSNPCSSNRKELHLDTLDLLHREFVLYRDTRVRVQNLWT